MRKYTLNKKSGFLLIILISCNAPKQSQNSENLKPVITTQRLDSSIMVDTLEIDQKGAEPAVPSTPANEARGLIAKVDTATQYIFTLTTPAKSFGSFTTSTGDVEVSWDYLSDSNSFRYPIFVFCTVGPIHASMGWERNDCYFQFGTGASNWDIILNRTVNYERIFNGKKFVNIMVRSNLTTQQLIIDGMLIEERMTRGAGPFTSDLIFSVNPTGLIIPRTMSGVIKNVKFSSVWTITPTALPQPIYDTLQFVPGYNIGNGSYANSPSVDQQLTNLMLPAYKAKCKPLYSFINTRYIAGLIPGHETDEVDVKANYINWFMSSYLNYGIRVDNLGELYSDIVNRKDTTYWNGLLKLINGHPEWRLDVTTVRAQIGAIKGGAVPVTKDFIDHMQPQQPSTVLQGDLGVYEAHGTMLYSLLSPERKASKDSIESKENDEYYNTFRDTATYKKNSAYLQALSASGLSVNAYCTRAFVRNFNYVMDGIRRTVPKVKIGRYDLHGGYYYNSWAPDLCELVNCITEHNSEPSFYTQKMSTWPFGYGEVRGNRYITTNYYLGTKCGINTMWPAVAAGWDNRAEVNVLPSQWIAQLQYLMMLGATSFEPAHFTLGTTSLQDWKGCLWQLYAPAYAQSVFSAPDDYNIVKNGVTVSDMVWNYFLVPGQEGEPKYSLWAGKPWILCGARHIANKYIITCANMRTYSFKSEYSNAIDAFCRIEGKVIPLRAASQGAAYRYDSNLPIKTYASGTPARDRIGENPVRISSVIKYGHPSWWGNQTVAASLLNDE